MKLNYKKSFKFVALLISAIIIGSVSASSYLYQNATISVMNGLVWVAGTNPEGATVNIDGPTVTLDMTGIGGSTTIYTDPVKLKNQHASSTITATVLASIDDLDADWDDRDSLVIAVYDATNPDPQATLTVWDGGIGTDLDIDLPIPAGEQWRFQWEITWNYDAAPTASVYVDLTVTFASPA
jgi:hypothetical protein